MKIADISINNKIVTQVNMYDSGTNFYKNINNIINQYKSVFIITQENISDGILTNISINNISKVKTFLLDDSPKCKSENQLKEILKFLIINKCNKNSLIIGIGGGSVSDIVGFSASIYMRGINHVIIPTTLLGMVDAAIGGKTAIDFNDIKNLIGTFKHPEKILIFPDFLLSLPKNEIINGFAEIIKYALIMDKNLFNFIDNNKDSIFFKTKFQDLNEIIIKCIKHKISIVEKDELDKNYRQILNFGHTAGHAIESYFDFKISHGVAVLYGIKVATKMSLELNKINIDIYDRIINLINTLNIPKINEIKINAIIDIMYFDKKSSNNQINFIILNNIGEAAVKKNIDVELIKKGLSIL